MSYRLIIFVIATGLSLISPAQTLHKFDFTPGQPVPGYIQVKTTSLYSEQTGYGWEFNSDIKSIAYGKEDGLKDGFITSHEPFYFSVKLPEGNYTVKVLLGDKKGTSQTTIKAECRRLMIEEVSTAKGKFQEAVFTVHVKDSLIKPDGVAIRLKPRERVYLHWDNKLTLEFNNIAPKLCAIEIIPTTEARTVFLAGNSTVVDQSEEPWAAWGQMIPAFFEPELISIANYAESGETLKAFQREKRLEKIWSMAKPGDYLFIEFAHNDQKPGGNYLEPFSSYKDTLKTWISAARARGLHPVLVTSTHRRSFDSSGKIINTLYEYPEAMRQTAREENVPLIDLNAMSKRLYEAMGPEGSLKAFVHFPANTFPNQPQELKDNTHFTTYGAYQLAKCVVEGIRQNLPELASALRKDLPPFNPDKPDAYKRWKLPASAFIGQTKPDGN